MTSIRLKITLGAVLLLLGSFAFLVVTNAFFLEPYYAAQTRGSFETILRAMAEAPSDDQSRLRKARELSSGTEYKIEVADWEGSVLLASVPEFRDGNRYPLPKEQLGYMRERMTRLEAGESFFGILRPSAPGQPVIQLVAALGGDRIIVVTQPLDHLRRSIALTSRFFLIVGGLALALEFALVLAISGTISRPILDLAEVARRLAARDLTARYPRKRDDELGLLGGTLNEMAAALAASIEELTEANAALARKVEAQESFVAGASHELKTPVGLVRGYAEALKLGMYASEAERAELADVILQESDHLARLVRDLADITVLGDAARSLALADGDLREAIGGAVVRFDLAAERRGVALRLEAGDPIPARFDRDRVLQVLDNLLSNAVRHAPFGSDVALRAMAQSGCCRIEVENGGEPIPEEDIPKLFEPFFRGDASHSRESGGSGLGLSLVKRIVEAHGGKCGIENGPSGVLAWVSLPLAGPLRA